ncbi:prepilin-type N-terminal cleavage/methylation domain-containing protein [Thioalkalivibrio sp.]|uniref:prepilin-type N-terminal cleavage/methylation domain-containing protein n=1 Tax=Thioalkalivibrio sp. TaxID=2093813 RepID=UPI0035690BB9
MDAHRLRNPWLSAGRVRGLTLIELVVALVVIAVAMVGLAGTFALLSGLVATEDAETFAREGRGCGEALLAVHEGPALELETQCAPSDDPSEWAEDDDVADLLAGACSDGVDLEVSCRVMPAADVAEDNPLSQVEIRRSGGGMPLLILQFPRETE